MSVKKWTLFFCFLWTLGAFAEPFSTHAAMWLLDTDEIMADDILHYPFSEVPPFGVLSETLLAGIDQAVAPIIVSSSLLKNIIIHYEIFKDFATSPLTEHQLELKYSSVMALNSAEKRNELQYYLKSLYHTIEDTNNTLQKSSNIGITVKELNKKYKDNAVINHILKSYWQQLDPFVKCFIVVPRLTHWLCKKINDSLYIIIPPKYMSLIGDGSFSTQTTLTETELRIGLKINHLKTVESVNMLSFKEYKDLEAPRLAQAIELLFVDQSLFVNKQAYFQRNQKEPKYAIPQWSFYILGHGSYQRKMAGLPIETMHKLLDFLQTSLVTKFLLFTSCYAGGKNLELLFRYQQKAIKSPFLLKTYTYPIVTTTIGDTTSISVTSPIHLPPYLLEKFIDPQVKKIDFVSYYNFQKFFVDLQKEPPIDFVQITNSVNIISESDKKIEILNNIPQIKLPGIEWIQVMDIPNEIVQIGKNFAQTRNAQQTLDVSTFFARRNKGHIYPEIILLYTTSIPFPLKLSRGKLTSDFQKPPTMISMIPGDAEHIFLEIDAHEFYLSEMFQSFIALSDLKSQKAFLIKKMLVKNDIDNWPSAVQVPYNGEEIVLTDVLILNNIMTQWMLFVAHNLFFTYKGTAYHVKWFDNPPIKNHTFINFTTISSNYMEGWQRLSPIIQQQEQLLNVSSIHEVIAKKHSVLMKHDFKQFLLDLEVLLKKIK